MSRKVVSLSKISVVNLIVWELIIWVFSEQHLSANLLKRQPIAPDISFPNERLDSEMMPFDKNFCFNFTIDITITYVTAIQFL